MNQLENTPACDMRDALRRERYDGNIKLMDITTRLSKLDVPKWLQADILRMANHNKMKRCTCPIEQALAGAVYSKIVKELMDEEKNNY